MTSKGRVFDVEVAHEAVRKDIDGVLGSFLTGEFAADRSIGEANWRGDDGEFFAIRWSFKGRHTGEINGFGHTKIAPTQNSVTVSGLTLVQNKKPGQAVGDLDEVLKSGTVDFHRFIDWLAVFAQIGVLHLGRPMPIAEITIERPERSLSRLPGYNDQQEGA